MNSKRKYTIETETAWNSLYTRLQNEGLVEEKDVSSRPSFRIKPWYWAAAILLAGCSITLLFILPSTDRSETIPLLTIRNEKGAGTWVKTLEDGSIIYLSDDTELTYPEHFAPGERIVTLNGNALFDVTGNKNRPFIIRTQQTEIEVIGTTFEVKSHGKKEFSLSVLEGEVKVKLKQFPGDVYVRSGDAITLSAGGKWIYTHSDEKEILDHMTRLIRFKDEPVGNIIQVINKSTEESYLAIHPSLQLQRLTVSFAGQTPEEIALVLSKGLGVSYTKEDNMLYISD
ncbi:MAG: FecR family protein [Tannerellaceae bacterium]|nr:FecR family protein [Tannerellaceae bacterium]